MTGLSSRRARAAPCTKYADTPREVSELVEQSAGGFGYHSQEGGLNNNGNDN
ncbi:MAG TPA: hypothetical protein VFV99_05080 [Kofleriaceae bacterium]|nr:hypothetical protein [Kofleriaceae bacterium]